MAFVSYYHQLAPAFYMASYAISSKLHFTLHHDYAVADPEGVLWVLWNPSFEGLPSKMLCTNVYEHYTHIGATHFSFIAYMHI